jgi:hypothetical protein
MRWRTAVALSVGSCALGATVVACFDLFHSTGDILTACEIDPATVGCLPNAGIDLCAASAVEARKRAEHACAWLGACETPFGRNAFGSCMTQALMAYDCKANPNHRFKGKAAGLWGCLGATRSCTDVHGCVFPGGREACASSGDSLSCGSADAAANNGDVRIECQGGVGGGENCALWGQTCAPSSSGAACAGSEPGGCSMGSGCFHNDGGIYTMIRWCTDAGDVGIDCASFGAQRCSGFPDPPDSSYWVACVAEEGVEAGATVRCTPDASATCVDGRAVSCPSGVVESLDCEALLGSQNACAAGPLAPPFDWTAPCVMSPSVCLADSCDGGTLNACGRGAVFSLDCADAGLGACATIATDDGQRAACAAPPP